MRGGGGCKQEYGGQPEGDQGIKLPEECKGGEKGRERRKKGEEGGNRNE